MPSTFTTVSMKVQLALVGLEFLRSKVQVTSKQCFPLGGPFQHPGSHKSPPGEAGKPMGFLAFAPREFGVESSLVGG